MKRIISLLTAVLFFAVSIISNTIILHAEEIESIEKTQLAGTTTYYEYDSEKQLLTISGKGSTPNFSSNGQGQPWYNWRSTAVKEVVVEEGVETLGSYFFYQMRASKYSLPSTLKKIGNYCFYSALNLTELDVPFGVTSIGIQAFRYNSTLKKISLPDTLKTIDTRAFEGCTGLTEFEVPYSVTSISTYAFYNCSNLSSFEFQSMTSAVSIGKNCFTGCANLTELSVPLNATLNANSFGYKSSSTKYPEVMLNVFPNSNSYNYAIVNSIKYNLIDTVKTECAVGYTNTYDKESRDKIFTYSFIPDTTEKYCIYTRGNCDVDAVLYQAGNEIESSQDISSVDRNFSISTELEAGKEYILTICSFKSVGTYTLWIYPERIDSFTVNGMATADAEKDMKTIDDSLLENFVLSISFADGLTDKVYYKNDFFAGTQMKQHEAELYCGETTGYIEIGKATASYPLFINHNYEAKDIPYTVDEDGYTKYSCVLCDDSYKNNYVPTPAIKIKGKIVFAEDKLGNHDSNKPYPYISKIVVDDVKMVSDRIYYVDSDGSYTINTFNSFDATFLNEHGENISFSFNVGNLEPFTVVERPLIVISNPYDFNNDKKVNAKDYAIFLKEKRSSLPKDYMEFFANFLL